MDEQRSAADHDCKLFGVDFGHFVVCWYWWLLAALLGAALAGLALAAIAGSQLSTAAYGGGTGTVVLGVIVFGFGAESSLFIAAIIGVVLLIVGVGLVYYDGRENTLAENS